MDTLSLLCTYESQHNLLQIYISLCWQLINTSAFYKRFRPRRFEGVRLSGGPRRLYPRGGYSGYILVGVCPGTPKKGGLRCGHSPKRGVLGAGTAPKKGGLRCGHNQKKGGLRHVYNPKKGEFMTDLVRSCSKGGLGSLFMYYLYFYLTI